MPQINIESLLAISLERQNVNLALKVLHESTSVGQFAYNRKERENQTVVFLKFINDVWKMFNVYVFNLNKMPATVFLNRIKVV